MKPQTQTLQGEYTHVYSGDPALDRSVEGWREKYDQAIERSDLALLPVVPGQKPARFRLRHLTRGERCKVVDIGSADGLTSASCAALQLGLVEVHDLALEDGTPIEIERSGKVGRFLGATEANLDQIVSVFGEEAVIGELADRVLATFRPRKG
jgi:hypothetical protein